MVLLAAGNARLLALDAKNGDLRWRKKDWVSQTPQVCDGRAYYTTLRKRPTVVDAKSGTVLSTTELGRKAEVAPVIVDKTAYVLDNDALLMALTESEEGT
ncbi:MAG: PQQ-binding-like beta-propeller repeat protein, partial [Phycisphaerae bacterium]